jgi:drug/metabolite transporter (DMT)-like permease
MAELSGAKGTTEHTRKDWTPYGGKVMVFVSLFLSIFLGVVAQVFIKKGLTVVGTLDFSQQLVNSYLRILFSPLVLVGLALYFLGVFFWLYALSKVELSFAFPFVSLSYVLVVLFSWLVLGENISYLRWVGVFVICLGVVLISRS